MIPLRLGIIVNTTKSRALEILPDFLGWLRKRSIPHAMASDAAAALKADAAVSYPPEEIADHVDVILSFGGDGTFLRTARLIAPREVPVIGVNLGGFGYLTEVGVDKLRACIDEIVAGNYQIQNRMILEAVISTAPAGKRFYGLNDIVIDRGGFTRAIRLETKIDGSYLNTFHADGLIVATPTGSTAYSLSVGGPIIEPCADGMIINPISPHMLANRPLVVRSDRVIEIEAYSDSGKFQISADGQDGRWQDSGCSVTIKRASFGVKMIVFEDYSFYSLLRNKLHWRNQIEKGSSGGH